MKKLALLSLLATLLIPAVINAATMEHPIGLEIWYPDDWKSQAEGDQLMVESPDQGAIVLFVVFEAKDLQAALGVLDTELGKVIQNMKVVTAPKEVTLNGLPGLMADGTGTIEGVNAEWGVGVFLHKDKALMVLGFADAAKYKTYEANLVKILNGIKAK